jgi:hypothetical protein
MPNFRSGNFKQKNKAFKGSNKSKSDFKDGPTVVKKGSKKIHKAEKKITTEKVKGQDKANRKNERQQRHTGLPGEWTASKFAVIVQQSWLTRHFPRSRRKGPYKRGASLRKGS